MLVVADTVLTMSGEALSPGRVRICGERITETGPHLTPHAGEEVIDLGGQILLPGLINAHCHLDYTSFKGAIFQKKNFTDWIKTINGLKANFSGDDFLQSIGKGFDLLARSGCTTVFNIEAFPELLLRMPRPPLRTWWFLELIDLRNRLGSDEVLLGALSFFENHPDWLGGFGLSPHAPYTASIELYRLAKRCSDQLKMPWTTHLAESMEEQEMFLYGKGALHDFLGGLGRENSDCGQGSALSHLLDFGVLSPACLIVHLNYLQEYDWQAIRQNRYSIVHCPRCHAYFKHARFPLERLQEAGSNICLGTDSLASNDQLDLRAEIRMAQHHYPHIKSRDWLKMVTVNPAEAIGLPGQLGTIQPNALADLIAFPSAHNSDPYTTVVRSESEPTFMMINGTVQKSFHP